MRLIVHGKGSHGRVVMSAALRLLSDGDAGWDCVYNTDDSVGTHPEDDDYAIIAIGDNATRKKACRGLLLSVVHPSAYVDASARLGAGVFVGPNGVVHIRATVGRGAIINTGATVEHDCRVGDWTHISPGAVLCGDVTVGEGTWIGANAVVKQGISIAPWSVIGCGAVVIRDIEEPGTYVGNPAHRVGGN